MPCWRSQYLIKSYEVVFKLVLGLLICTLYVKIGAEHLFLVPGMFSSAAKWEFIYALRCNRLKMPSKSYFMRKFQFFPHRMLGLNVILEASERKKLIKIIYNWNQQHTTSFEDILEVILIFVFTYVWIFKIKNKQV